jgi:fido (protein-threonine AMPylation protein)
MGKTRYRVEVVYPHKKKPQYYLVKDVKVKGKKRKVRKYLGIVPLSEEEKDKARDDYAYEMEMRAAHKRAELSSAFFRSQYLALGQMISVETIRFIYKTFMDLLTTNEIEVYERDFEISYVQGTTSIEGNTLTLRQTHDLLVNGLPPDHKSLREINEVQNFKSVKSYRDSYRGRVTIDFIKTLHALAMNNIDTQSAGMFRRIDDVGISGCDIRVTPAPLIEQELNEIIMQYYSRIREGWHPFEEAIMFHYKFEIIHPFLDGNGRVGREILNYMLKRIGYPKLLFLGTEREIYINALRSGNSEKFADMIQVFVNLITNQRLSILKTNLRKVVIPPKKIGQVRISDFFEPSSEIKEITALAIT